MSEIIEQIGDSSYPVGLVIRMGIMGTVSVSFGSNIMAAVGEASHGPAMTVMPLTAEGEVSAYFRSGPLARAGKVGFAQGLPAGYFIRVLGAGYANAKKYAHDGLSVTETETFYGGNDEGPYDLGYKCYTQSVSNSIQIGEGSPLTIVYALASLGAGKVYLDQENGQITFYTGEGPEAADLVTCSLVHYGNIGTWESPNTGITGNSAFVVVRDGTFNARDVEEFPGDGSVGPYYLKFRDLVEDDENSVLVGNTERTVVYSSGDLGAGKVYADKSAGSVTFFAGEEPEETDAITVNVLYKSKKLTVHDGEKVYPDIDNLDDLVAIQAALIYDQIVNFTPDATATHLPANGTYKLVGGDDGNTIAPADYGEASDVLHQYIEDNMVNICTCVYCDNEISPGTYDLIPILAGKLNEAKKNFYPYMGFIGMQPNEAVAHANAISSNFNNYELVVVVNPWDKTEPERLDATVARAAQEATAPLGASCARRVSNMSLQGLSAQGLLNTYRRETVRALHNGRLDVLVKTNSGLFSFYGRNTSNVSQYMECVDVRTINYMVWVIKWYTDMFYFAKNTPSVRATFREDIANTLDRLVADEVMDAFTLTVKSGRSEGNKGLVRVKLEAENVGHIKQFIVDYYNGIIANAVVAE
jgi:hypothetical protein